MFNPKTDFLNSFPTPKKVVVELIDIAEEYELNLHTELRELENTLEEYQEYARAYTVLSTVEEEQISVAVATALDFNTTNYISVYEGVVSGIKSLFGKLMNQILSIWNSISNYLTKSKEDRRLAALGEKIKQLLLNSESDQSISDQNLATLVKADDTKKELQIRGLTYEACKKVTELITKTSEFIATIPNFQNAIPVEIVGRFNAFVHITDEKNENFVENEALLTNWSLNKLQEMNTALANTYGRMDNIVKLQPKISAICSELQAQANEDKALAEKAKNVMITLKLINTLISSWKIAIRTVEILSVKGISALQAQQTAATGV